MSISEHFDGKDLTISTGKAEIDQQMGGGIPWGSLTLVEGKHGTGKSVFCQHLVHSTLGAGKAVAFYSSETGSPSLISQMSSLGLDVLDYFLLDKLRVFPLELPVGNSTHITEMVGNFAAHLTRDEMAYGAQEWGLNWGSIRAPDELVDEGHLNDRGFWVEVPHPELDRSFKYPGPAGIYNGSPWRISRRAPLIGEHNEEIYCGELGLQRTELAYLAESGVV